MTVNINKHFLKTFFYNTISYITHDNCLFLFHNDIYDEQSNSCNEKVQDTFQSVYNFQKKGSLLRNIRPKTSNSKSLWSHKKSSLTKLPPSYVLK